MSYLTGFRTDRQGSFIVKDPQATLDYSIDWSEWIANNDNIDSSEWFISEIDDDADPLIEVSNFNTSLIATIIVSGGTAGNIYTLTNRITTDNELVDERFFRIVVKEKTA
jgi:hypothetical protein